MLWGPSLQKAFKSLQKKNPQKKWKKKMAKMCPLRRGRSMARWQTKPKTRYSMCPFPCANRLILSYQFSILQICNYKKISHWYDDKCLLPKNRGEGGGIKLTYQSPLLDLVKVYALCTIFLQICIYKYMPLHVRIEALPT